MSKSFETFQRSILDATDLLDHFDRVNTQPPPENAEVLKRASLVMACTALETYLEDRITESADALTRGQNDSVLGRFFHRSLTNDLKYFHAPSTERVRALFERYLGLDVTVAWSWNNYDPARAKTELNQLVQKRGDIVHRSPAPQGQVPAPHPVTRDSLQKNIRFIRDLVMATDKYLESHAALS